MTPDRLLYNMALASLMKQAEAPWTYNASTVGPSGVPGAPVPANTAKSVGPLLTRGQTAGDIVREARAARGTVDTVSRADWTRALGANATKPSAWSNLAGRVGGVARKLTPLALATGITGAANAYGATPTMPAIPRAANAVGQGLYEASPLPLVQGAFDASSAAGKEVGRQLAQPYSGQPLDPNNLPGRGSSSIQ